MNRLIKNKIDITVLVTSISQREITIATANYYSKICSEVVLVDEEQPHLSVADISAMKNRGITYISYTKNGYSNGVLEKRIIAASQSNNKYVVHSNHDERYTYYGLIACVAELEKDKNLTFCAGQVIAVRRSESKIHFTRPYKNLCGYQNINKVEQRLYYHSNRYAPLAHFAVWRRNSYINVTKETLKIHNLMPSSTMMDEVIFELAADLSGNSKAVPELYWIRNRVNPTSQKNLEKGDQVFKIIENKLHILLNDLDNVQMDIIINSFWKNFPFIHPSFVSKSIILIKRKLRILKKKKVRRDIDNFLNDNKIKYEKHDISNVLNSMSL
jgi:hypothetical protein